MLKLDTEVGSHLFIFHSDLIFTGPADANKEELVVNHNGENDSATTNDTVKDETLERDDAVTTDEKELDTNSGSNEAALSQLPAAVQTFEEMSSTENFEQ